MDLKEIQDIIKNVMYTERPLTHTEILNFEPTGIAQNESANHCAIPYKEWRVVAVGFCVTLTGVGTQDPEIEFGYVHGDLGAADIDAFGSVKQPTEAGDPWVPYDAWVHDPYGFCATPDPVENGREGTWDEGGGKFGVWQTKMSTFRVTRPNDHQLTLIPWMMVEVRN